MKKFAVSLILSAGIFFTCPQNTYAVFSVELDRSVLDFGLMKNNEIKEDQPYEGVLITCTSDQANRWYLRTHLETPLTNRNNASAIIPNENFFWYGINSTGSGTLTMMEQDYSQERVIYAAPAGEGANGVGIRMQFKVRVPSKTQAGEYAARVILTMIE